MKKDLRLISLDPSTGNFNFSWNSKSGTLTGREKLVQSVVKRILTAKGSNQFNKEYGENFYNLFRTIDYSQEQKVKEAFPVLLKNIEEKILSKQALNSSLTLKEKLKALNLISIDLDINFGAWIIEIEIVTQDGVTNKFSVT